MKAIFTLVLTFILSISVLNAQWTKLNNATSNTTLSIVSHNTTILIGTYGAGVYKSTNTGTTWTAVNTGLTNMNIITMYVVNDTILAGTENGIFKSTNEGDVWTAINTNLSSGTQVWSITKCFGKLWIGTQRNLNKTLWSSTNGGGIWFSEAAWENTQGVGTRRLIYSLYSIADTAMWACTDSGVFRYLPNGGFPIISGTLKGKYVFSLLHLNANIFLAGTSIGIFKTTTGGNPWTLLTSGMTNVNKLLKDQNGFLFTGCGQGFLISNTYGETWIPKNEGISPVGEVLSLSLINQNFYSSDVNNSLWKRAYTNVVTEVKRNPQVPVKYYLSQNSPNPFNPSTSIRYEVPKLDLVNLKVFDVNGKEIMSFVNELKSPGYYTVKFDGTSLSSGVYYYKLETNGFVQTKKMLLLK